MDKMIEEKCPLFNICNCKTAMCRAVPPDDSCYYYRYFKSIIDAKAEKMRGKFDFPLNF